jgi:nitroimidazol reductase NimA-like FMN-containing flavoprotein (pyridoxamine 5'-phosphate oxidase superfamily)/GNAT superfamily N-acetyltransferase
MHDNPPPTAGLFGPHVKLKRHPERGSHERVAVHAIIDASPIAHVAFTSSDGVPMCMPTAHARIGDQLYLHGAAQNRMLRSLCERARASMTFTMLDGLVLARTAFHHSMNFRSAVVFGPTTEVTDLDEKRLALHALIEHMAPGRMRELSTPTDQELRVTLVVRVDMDEASAKVRQGGPIDASADLERDVWAGTVPLALTPAAPVPDPQLRAGQAMSEAAAKRALPTPSALHERRRAEYLFSCDPALLQLPWIHAFLRDESYWARGLDEAHFRAALQRSLCFGVYRAGQQVGFARVVTDQSRVAYVCYVFVEHSLRGRGIGQELMQRVLSHPEVQGAARCLLGTQDAHTFYERFGFKRAEPGRYMLRSSPPEALA